MYNPCHSPTKTIGKVVALLLMTIVYICCTQQTSTVNSQQVLVTNPRSWPSLLKRALLLGRTGRWNEFLEEKLEPTRLSAVVSPTPITATTTTTTTATLRPTSTTTSTTATATISIIANNNNRTKLSQNLVDETKDPESPYYISMITSNIGAGYIPLAIDKSTNKSNNNNNHNSNSTSKRDSSSFIPAAAVAQPGLVNKLFNYAFSTTAPSRAMQTTRRPLVTYINISNLEEHETENPVKLNILSEDNNTLQLLNNAETNSASFQAKKQLPECATQQVCSAHYVKSNHTQRLCECPRDYNWNCQEVNQSEDHTIDLTRKHEYKVFSMEKRTGLQVYTQVKLCENLKSIKPCKTPTDWTIMALQSERTGKAHYVVVCKCPDASAFEGPFTHKHPPYARFPGIRVYGMLCNQGNRKSKEPKTMEIDQNSEYPEFPWELAYAVINATATQGYW